MRIKPLSGLAFAALFLCACQSDSYRIKGFARYSHDGDTVCLTTEDYHKQIIAETTVNNGLFVFSGQADSAILCRAFLKKDDACGVTFFLEPELITVELNPLPEHCRVSGTIINNEWQLLSDSVNKFSRFMSLILKRDSYDSTSHIRHVQAIDSLHRRISDCITNAATRNKNNCMGLYIRERYKKPEFK